MNNILFDKKADQLKRQRAQATFNEHNFLFDWSMDQITQNLELIRKEFPQRASIDDLDSEILPFAEDSLDLIISNLNLHKVNDLPGILIQSRLALKEDGLFVGSLFGGETLFELKDVLQQAEMEVYGGISPRVFPFADIRDIGALLQRAQFNLPVIDTERVTVTYPTLTKLVHDLRYMGQGNILVQRNRKPVGKRFWQRAEEIYQEKYSEDRQLIATFDIIFAMGWKASESQQKPMRPGSAQNRLADALNTDETTL